MNLGLVTSFIIAGLLMLTIVSMNMRVSQNSQDITMHSMSQNHISAISDLIQHDFPKIGHETAEEAVTVAEENKIQFNFSNLIDDDDYLVGPNQNVTWELKDVVLAGSNSRHRSLVRTVIVDGVVDVQEINVGVTRFEILYYSFGDLENPLPTPVSNLENIDRIEVILEVQPREGTGRNNQYTTSSWHRVFTPPNLNL